MAYAVFGVNSGNARTMIERHAHVSVPPPTERNRLAAIHGVEASTIYRVDPLGGREKQTRTALDRYDADGSIKRLKDSPTSVGATTVSV